MPIRSSRSSAAAIAARRRVAAAPDPHLHEIARLRHVIGRQGAVITMLCIILACFAFAGALMLFQQSVRLSSLEQTQTTSSERDLQQVDSRLQGAMQELSVLEQRMATQSPVMQAMTPPTTPTVPTNALPVSEPSSSPTGQLDRGMMSPDGSKYAGYEDTVKGKIGIAVEILSLNSTTTHKIKYIVIFNPFTQSTGLNSPQGTGMSVRWKDNSTIEYDVLTKKGSSWVKETSTVKIFF